MPPNRSLQQEIAERLIVVGFKEPVTATFIAGWILKHFDPKEGHFPNHVDHPVAYEEEKP